MGAGDHEVTSSLENFALEKIGHGNKRPLLLKQGFHFGVPPTHRIPYNIQIDVVVDMGGIEAIEKRDAFLFEEGRHRRIDASIGAGDFVAKFSERCSNGTHRGTANAEEVEMFQRREIMWRVDSENI